MTLIFKSRSPGDLGAGEHSGSTEGGARTTLRDSVGAGAKAHPDSVYGEANTAP